MADKVMQEYQKKGQRMLKLKAAYRCELIQARLNAIKLANKLLERGIEGAISGDTVDAMREILKDAREVFGTVKKGRKLATGTGIPSEYSKLADEILGNDDK